MVLAPGELVCIEAACTMRLDGVQYLVLTLIGSSVLCLLLVQLVRAEAVPILRG